MYTYMNTQEGSLCLYFDPLLIILPLDEPLVALGGFLPADEEEFPENFEFSDFRTNPHMCIFRFGIFNTKYSKILQHLRSLRRPNLKVKVLSLICRIFAQLSRNKPFRVTSVCLYLLIFYLHSVNLEVEDFLSISAHQGLNFGASM